MVRAGIQAEHGAIHLVRNPRERVPVCLLIRGESPDEIGAAQPGGDVGIAHDVLHVIEIDERMVRDRPINGRGAKRENKADERKIFLAGRRGGYSGLRT